MSETLWTRFIDLQARPVTRRLRRIFVGTFLLMIAACYSGAIVNLLTSRHHAYGCLNIVSAFVPMCSAMVQGIALMFICRRANSTMSMEERAQLDFDMPYAQLSPKQRFDVYVRVRREMHAGGRPSDERDFLAQGEAERLAFRAVRVGLSVLAIALWIASFFLSRGQLRGELLVAAVAVSGVTIPVIFLPDIIRLWTQPDDVGEPELAERRA